LRPLFVAALIVSCDAGKPSAPPFDLSVCVGDVDVDGACDTMGCSCKDGLACRLTQASRGICRPVCLGLPPPCVSGYCCATSASVPGGGLSSTCEDQPLPGVQCDTLDASL
jgi:hypothetical protein